MESEVVDRSVIDHFFDKAMNDPVIDSIHIALFIVLYRQWSKFGFPHRLKLDRSKILAEAKISSNATFYRKLRELNENHYLNYMPNYNPSKGSYVNFE